MIHVYFNENDDRYPPRKHREYGLIPLPESAHFVMIAKLMLSANGSFHKSDACGIAVAGYRHGYIDSGGKVGCRNSVAAESDK